MRLPFKAQWQAIANDLPRGDVLMVLPHHNTAAGQTLETVATDLRARGHHVTTLPADRFSP